MHYLKHCNNLAIRLGQLHEAEKAIAHHMRLSPEYGHILASVKAEQRDIVRQLENAALAELIKPDEPVVELIVEEPDNEDFDGRLDLYNGLNFRG